MNFGKAKKIFIFLFLFINLFLIFQLYKMTGSENIISKPTLEKTISLCESRGLKIEENAILRRVEKLNFLELTNSLASKTEAEKQFPHFTFQVEGMFSLSPEQKVVAKNEKEVLKYLNQSGLYSFNLVSDRILENPITGEKNYRFVQCYGSYKIFGAYTNAKVLNSSVLSAEGNVYKLNNSSSSSTDMISPLQIVLDIANSLNGKKTVLKGVEQGYFIPKDSKNYQNLTALPCYSAFLSDRELFYDAKTGEFLLCITYDGGEIYDKKTVFDSI